MIVNGIVEPMELAHLPYKKGTYEDYVGERSLEKREKKWRRHVADVHMSLPREVQVRGGVNYKNSEN
jgi:polyphosphate glucokinase